MKNEKAISPVIGVILMVAITVILAAVIGTFVIGMSGYIENARIPDKITGLVIDKFPDDTQPGGYVDIITNGSQKTLYENDGVALHHMIIGKTYEFKLTASWNRYPTITSYQEVVP